MDTPRPPARLVMLSPPAPGAEYALSKVRMRVGRAEDLDVWVNHRSISREHAEIVREGDRLKLRDLKSANGVRVNGREIRDAYLSPGDRVELGQVTFRFVGEGERYVFDAERTLQMDALLFDTASSRAPLVAAAGIIAVAVVVGGVIAMSSSGAVDHEALAGPVERQRPPPRSPASPAKVPVEEIAVATLDAGVDAERTDDIDEFVTRCRAELEAFRLDEASRWAGAALAIDSSHRGALDCQAAVAARRTDESRFEEAMRSWRAGEVETAFNALAELPSESPLRAREEVQLVARRYAQDRVDAARRNKNTAAGPRHAAEALRACEFASETIPSWLCRDARQLQRRRAEPPETVMVNQQPPPPPPTPPAPPPPLHPPTAPPPPVTAVGTGDPLRDCLQSSNYSQCVIRAFGSRSPRNPREMAGLIEAYRLTGNSGRMRSLMQQFVSRFPTHSRTPGYRREIGP
jgi:hypothetical protein